LIGIVVAVGVRVWLIPAERQACGAPRGAALLLSVQVLGAAPSATECLGLALTAPRPQVSRHPGGAVRPLGGRQSLAATTRGE